MRGPVGVGISTLTSRYPALNDLKPTIDGQPQIQKMENKQQLMDDKLEKMSKDPNYTTGKYIMDGNGNPVQETNLLEWAKWMETSNKRIAGDEANGRFVSTVFLGVDYGFSNFGLAPNEQTPVLYETMVFQLDPENKGNFIKSISEDDKGNELSERYRTKDEALKGHQEIVNLVRQMPKIKQDENN